MNPTDALTIAVADWLSVVVANFTPDAPQAWDAMVAGRCDVRVVIGLREGSLCVDAVDLQGRYTELEQARSTGADILR